ncbi:MAG: family 20 glycosylhydrolase, partial [Tannerellaceae bacterium]
MNKLSKYALALVALIGTMACTEGKKVTADYGIIPLPQEVVLADGSPFVLKSSTQIVYPEGNKQMKQTADFLASYIQQSTGYIPKVVAQETAQKGCINLMMGNDAQNKEGYQLTVQSDGINIAGASEAGVFYGVQTLRKSLPATATGSAIELPACTINDYPRFAYRGMMLDVSRHFFPVDSIKRMIDILALNNINTLHWHLSDDQGWRIEIKKYPKLTEVGANRKETVIGRNSGKYDGIPYGGFYTQDQIR